MTYPDFLLIYDIHMFSRISKQNHIKYIYIYKSNNKSNILLNLVWGHLKEIKPYQLVHER
jgi:hypothetical protein